MNRTRLLLWTSVVLTGFGCSGISDIDSKTKATVNVAYVNGKWFNGRDFDDRTAYSTDGRLTFRRPRGIGSTIDLGGAWVVPPFADGHNHSLGTGVEDRDRKAIARFLADGVFYVKIQGNLPMTDEWKRRLEINTPGSIDVALAHGTLTASGGWPIPLIERVLLPQGYFPGHTRETLKDFRYFTVDSEAELEEKWLLIAGYRPDFIKTFLWFSDEFEKRRDDPAFAGQRGLDPGLLLKIVQKAHANGLRVSTHVTTAADFRNAVAAGVDEIAHLPLLGRTPIDMQDARLARQRGTVIVTTCAVVGSLPRTILPEDALPQVLATQLANLETLHEQQVQLAVGSDNVNDSSVGEIEYLRRTGVFDNLTLLTMWTDTTARMIFPDRKIGQLREGYEASFLALDGNPIENFDHVRSIRLRVKQGLEVRP